MQICINVYGREEEDEEEKAAQPKPYFMMNSIRCGDKGQAALFIIENKEEKEKRYLVGYPIMCDVPEINELKPEARTSSSSRYDIPYTLEKQLTKKGQSYVQYIHLLKETVEKLKPILPIIINATGCKMFPMKRKASYGEIVKG